MEWRCNKGEFTLLQCLVYGSVFISSRVLALIPDKTGVNLRVHLSRFKGTTVAVQSKTWSRKVFRIELRVNNT